jgi:hypothetical protein
MAEAECLLAGLAHLPQHFYCRFAKKAFIGLVLGGLDEQALGDVVQPVAAELFASAASFLTVRP